MLRPDQATLLRILRYEPETGKLYWRPRTHDQFKDDARWSAAVNCARWNSAHAEREAFTAIGTHGYHVSSIAGFGTLLAHRVIAVMVTGEWPEEADHDNRNRTDNRWRNLNPTTHSGNKRNLGPGRGRSGVRGVAFIGQRGCWRATIHDDGRTIRLGDYRNLDDAIAARRKAERELGYHRNHGSPTPQPAPS